jgi:NAD-dependent dihydropyrimidine dehydrogenase PreA subunit
MSKKILFCNCEGDRITADRLQSIKENLKQVKADILWVSDLCRLTVTGSDELVAFFSEGNEYLIIGCYSRTLKLLLESSLNGKDKIPVTLLNFVESDNEQLYHKIEAFCADSQQENCIREIITPNEWPSWFPIIDYSRCTACGQCAVFCLFGVYDKSEKRVSVVNPRGCKNNCPACARICPHTAIIFPKYKHGGAISGSEEIDELAEQKRQVMDMESILGSDIYSALEQRKLKRQSIIRNDAMKKAMEERENALRENGTL